MPDGEEKVQAQAQMGRSLHYWPSSDRWSVPSAGCIEWATWAEPMERSQAPKILRLAPDSMFVSFLCPFFAYTLSVFFLFLPFILSQGLQGPTCASLAHYRRANRAHYTWGLLTQKLNYLSGLLAPHMCYSSACTFSSPLYASIWLKFWPSWLAWLLYLCPRFPLIRLGCKGSTSAIVTAGSAGCVP